MSKRLLELVDRHGWEDGVSQYLGSLTERERPSFFRRLHLGAQASWIYLVGDHPTNAVLVVDPSPGTLTIALSKVFGRVVGVFLDEDNKACARARVVSEDCTNVQLLSPEEMGEAGLLPGEFDVIAIAELDGLLDTVSGELARDEAVPLLTRLEGLLNPAGHMYLGLRHASLRTRIRQRGGPARHGGVRAFLKNQGWDFEVLRTITIYPGLGNIELITCDTKPAGPLGRLKGVIRKVAKDTASGAIVGRHTARYTGGIGQLAGGAGDDCDTAANPVTEVHVGSAEGIILVRENMIIRIPQRSSIVERCAHNHAVLSSLAALALPVPVPAPLGIRGLGDQVIFLESRLPGAMPEQRWVSTKHSGDLAGQAMRFLAALQQSSGTRRVCDGEIFEAAIGEQVRYLYPYVDEQNRASLASLCEGLEERLATEELWFVRSHGDFKRSNLLCAPNGRVVGVIDWDLSQSSELSRTDLVFYAAYELCLWTNIGFDTAILEIAFGGKYRQFSWCTDFLRRDARTDPGHAELILRVSGLLCLIYRFHFHAHELFKRDAAWRDAHILPEIRTAVQNISQYLRDERK